VVIENQLETTNHDHLGKIITYASGFDAEIVIWIVKDVRDEHKQAVDWLNEHTDEKINIFIIRMELWQIGDSLYAPKFYVVSKPNDWVKALKIIGPSDLSERRIMQLDFWTQFKDYATSQKSTLRLRKVNPQNWYDISIGNAKSYLILFVDADDKQIRCELRIPDSKPLFKALWDNKDIIETELPGHKLEWMELEGKKASRIGSFHEIDVENNENWEKSFQWLMETAQEFQSVFANRVKNLTI